MRPITFKEAYGLHRVAFSCGWFTSLVMACLFVIRGVHIEVKHDK